MATAFFCPTNTTSRFPLVHDHSGQALAYVYFEDEPGRGSAAKLLTKDEAQRIAVVTGLKEQLIGLNYQATADQFGIFQRGIFSNAERSSAQRKQRAHRCRKFG